MAENENAVIVVPRETSLSLKQITDRVNLVHTVLEKVMKKGTHYGTVPGCGDKMVLLKPGADVLAMTFKLVPRFEVTRTDLGDGHREYDVTCSMYGPTGELLGQGVGSASTMEKKYRYRKDASGKRGENEDIADTYNTVLKIAKKRSHVDATLTVTGAGDLFTQDLIDEDDEPANPKITPPRKKEDAPPAEDNLDMGKPPAKQSDGDGLRVVGKLEGMAEPFKSVSKKTGKPFTKWGLIVDGTTYGTFHESVKENAEAIIGEQVELTLKAEGKYKNVEAIALVR